MKGSGRYVCEADSREQIVFAGATQVWCGCGKRMKFDRALNAAEKKDFALDERELKRDQGRYERTLAAGRVPA